MDDVEPTENAVTPPPVDPAADTAVDLVVDVANVMGSRPDGWWRDRAAAAHRLTVSLSALPGVAATGPDGTPLRVAAVYAVVEGRARDVPVVEGIDVVRAPADGDTAVVLTCSDLLAAGRHPLAVTADRGLRDRLPPGAEVTGPRWLLALIG